MEFRKIFDTIPEQFDKFRPRYSQELFDSLIDYAKIGPGKKVLELGPGTGQATEPILNTGCDHMVIAEPYKTKFFEGLHNAVLAHGNKIIFNDTYVMYLAKKPEA